jgi:hypothetical protein
MFRACVPVCVRLCCLAAPCGDTCVVLMYCVGLCGLETLEFAGHARSFSGASLSVLAVALPCLSRLVISSNKPGAVDYTLALPALAGLRALTRRCAVRVWLVWGCSVSTLGDSS